MKMNIKPSTIARIGVLLVALVNQCLITFGRGILPFTENVVYQVISLAAVVIIAAINAWYNNDISKLALLCGGVFKALSDGRITEEEIEKILANAKQPERVEQVKQSHYIVRFINGIIASIKSKFQKK